MTMVWSPDYAPVDGDFDNVSLLLKGEGTNGSTTILDSSSNNLSVTANGDAQIINTVATPFSPAVPSDGVLAFDGIGDTITASSSIDFELNSGDFTLETWVYVLSYPSAYVSVGNYSKSSVSNAADYSWSFGLSNSGAIYFESYNGFLSILTGTSTISQLTWSHIAVTREGDTFRTFANGQISATATKSGSIVTPSSCQFKAGQLGPFFPLNGYISNLRITKGVARYTENFDVPTAPFPIYSPTTRAQA